MNVAIVGAANSAVDAALETFRKGSVVTMIIREKKSEKMLNIGPNQMLRIE